MKVSIITISYNAAKTIEQTICSVLGQSYQNIEYIVIDGGSTDGTQDIVLKYNDRISCFISEPDEGIYDAMNKGLRHATGDIVAFLNSDDWYEDGVIEKVVKCFESTEAEIVHGEIWTVDGNGNLSRKSKWDHNYESLWCGMLPHPATFTKISVFKRLEGFNTEYRISADRDWLLRCYLAGAKLQHMDDVVTYFRLGGASSGGNRLSKLMILQEDRAITLKYIRQKWKMQNPESKRIEQMTNWRYKIREFIIETEYNPTILYDLLCHHFGEINKGIFIFGIGIWGERVCKLLKQCNVEIRFFTDNNRDKWGTELYGVKIIPPQELCKEEGHVLIAVQDYGIDIATQLKGYHNERLDWITIDEIIAEASFDNDDLCRWQEE